jgi:hypothetical protein
MRDLLVKTVTRLLALFCGITRPPSIRESQTPVTWPVVAGTICAQTRSVDLRIPRIVKDDIGPAYGLREDLIAKLARQVGAGRAAADVGRGCVARCAARHETLLRRGVARPAAANPGRSARSG